MLRTVNPERAKQNLEILDAQRPELFGDAVVVNTPSELLDMPFTPRRGDHAQAVVISTENAAELRDALEAAGKAELLRNKQIILLVCGEVHEDAEALRETALQGGALMVWSPRRQLTPEASYRVRDLVLDKLKSYEPAKRPRTIDLLMEEVLKDVVNDADLQPLRFRDTWVRIQLRGQTLPG